MRKKSSSKEKTFVDPRYIKTGHYKKAMEEIVQEKVCPLCPKTMKWHTKPILKTIGSWFITENFQPYENAKHHLLIISTKHIENLTQIKASDWKNISQLVNWGVRKFKIPGGGITMRFGDTTYTGATIKHLHLHLIVPQVKNNKANPVYFPIG